MTRQQSPKNSVKFEYLNFYGGVKFGGGFGWPKKNSENFRRTKILRLIQKSVAAWDLFVSK